MRSFSFWSPVLLPCALSLRVSHLQYWDISTEELRSQWKGQSPGPFALDLWGLDSSALQWGKAGTFCVMVCLVFLLSSLLLGFPSRHLMGALGPTPWIVRDCVNAAALSELMTVSAFRKTTKALWVTFVFRIWSSSQLHNKWHIFKAGPSFFVNHRKWTTLVLCSMETLTSDIFFQGSNY